MSSKPRVVILGAGYAGMLAALRLSGKVKQADITLINASDKFMQRIRFHQVAARQRLREYAIPKLLGKRQVRFVQGWITGLDLDSRQVQVKVNDETQEFGYDYLVFALGSIAARPNIPGVDEFAYAMGNKDAAAALQNRLKKAQPGEQVVVIGGGLTGIESATEIMEAYPDLRVRLVTGGKTGQSLSKRGRSYVRHTLAEMGIRLQEHTRINAITQHEIVTDKNERVAYDVAIWSGSFTVPALARECGFSVNNIGQINIDSFMRSVSHPEVYAVGDAAVFAEQTALRMACATAMPQGAHAADNLAALINGKPQQPFSFNYALQCVSLGRKRGLVQFVDHDDTPLDRILSGTVGALVKEFICQFTVRSLQLERMLPGSYWWPGKNGKATKHTQQAERAVS